MKQKKVPMRMCVETKEKIPKKDLIRIVMYNGEIKVDETGKQNGRGCYLKKDKETILNAKKHKTLNRVFESEIREEIYEEILKLVD